MSTSIEPGQVVQLKSGGPQMTVGSVDGLVANVMLFDVRGTLVRYKIAGIALVGVLVENKPNAEGDVVAISEGQELTNPQRSGDENWPSSGSGRPEDSGVSGGVVPAASPNRLAPEPSPAYYSRSEQEAPASNGT